MRGVLATLAVCLSGCASAGTYYVKTNVPWPDEWVTGPREPYSRPLRIAGPTLDWHHNLNVERLADTTQKKIDGKPAVYGYARVDYARKREDPTQPDDRAVAYVEARVVPVWVLPNDPRIGGQPVRGKLEGMLQVETFPRVECGRPQVIRSIEYRSESAFLSAIDAAARASASRQRGTTLETLTLKQWTVDYVNRVCGGVEGAPFMLGRQRVGMLRPDDVTTKNVSEVKRYLATTLNDHVQ